MWCSGAAAASRSASTALVMEDLPIVPLHIGQDFYAFRRGVEWKPRNDDFLIASEISRTP